MPRPNSLQTWIDNGYALFAREGLEGIQVERLAKILNLNKSGYYHYFGSQDVYLEQLMNHHFQLADPLAKDMRKIRQFDPDFFQTLLRYKTPVMVHMQLVRNRHHPSLEKTFVKVNNLVDPAVVPSFPEFIGMPGQIELGRKYFELSRDMFYSRITEDKMNEEYLRSLLYEVRKVLLDAIQHKSIE